jgi:hypothetical protein
MRVSNICAARVPISLRGVGTVVHGGNILSLPAHDDQDQSQAKMNTFMPALKAACAAMAG